MESGLGERTTHQQDKMSFTILKGALTNSPRLGRLAIPGQTVLDTPGYIAIASRGVIPHLSQDNFQSKTTVGGAYLALEDFVERPPNKVPIYQYSPPDGSTPIHSFCALPDETPLVLGPRRTQPVPNLRPNTAGSITLWTAFGARELQVKEYVDAVTKLGPDIAIGPCDLLHGFAKPSKARMAKMGDRSESWVRALATTVKDTGAGRPALFVPMLPIAKELQWQYLEALQELGNEQVVQGIALYDDESMSAIPSSLVNMPRLAFTEPSGAAEILDAIARGTDIFTIPFINNATDASIALTFAFARSEPTPTHDGFAPLGIDMRDDTHSTDTGPIMNGCECYACINHHRAYIHHLFAAKEMLAWTLLQIHNHHTMDRFFSAVRQSLADGKFNQDRAAFEAAYERLLPAASGQGPRARGYQFKSEGLGELKENEKPYTTFEAGHAVANNVASVRTLDHAAEGLEEGSNMESTITAADLERAGLGKTA